MPPCSGMRALPMLGNRTQPCLRYEAVEARPPAAGFGSAPTGRGSLTNRSPRTPTSNARGTERHLQPERAEQLVLPARPAALFPHTPRFPSPGPVAAGRAQQPVGKPAVEQAEPLVKPRAPAFSFGAKPQTPPRSRSDTQQQQQEQLSPGRPDYYDANYRAVQKRVPTASFTPRPGSAPTAQLAKRRREEQERQARLGPGAYADGVEALSMFRRAPGAAISPLPASTREALQRLKEIRKRRQEQQQDELQQCPAPTHEPKPEKKDSSSAALPDPLAALDRIRPRSYAAFMAPLPADPVPKARSPVGSTWLGMALPNRLVDLQRHKRPREQPPGPADGSGASSGSPSESEHSGPGPLEVSFSLVEPRVRSLAWAPPPRRSQSAPHRRRYADESTFVEEPDAGVGKEEDGLADVSVLLPRRPAWSFAHGRGHLDPSPEERRSLRDAPRPEALLRALTVQLRYDLTRPSTGAGGALPFDRTTGREGRFPWLQTGLPICFLPTPPAPATAPDADESALSIGASGESMGLLTRGARALLGLPRTPRERRPEPGQYDVSSAFRRLLGHIPGPLFRPESRQDAAVALLGREGQRDLVLLALSQALGWVRPRAPAFTIAPLPSTEPRRQAKWDRQGLGFSLEIRYETAPRTRPPPRRVRSTSLYSLDPVAGASKLRRGRPCLLPPCSRRLAVGP